MSSGDSAVEKPRRTTCLRCFRIEVGTAFGFSVDNFDGGPLETNRWVSLAHGGKNRKYLNQWNPSIFYQAHLKRAPMLVPLWSDLTGNRQLKALVLAILGATPLAARWLGVWRLGNPIDPSKNQGCKPLTRWLSGFPEKSPNFLFTTKIVFPKSLKFMNSGSELNFEAPIQSTKGLHE